MALSPAAPREADPTVLEALGGLDSCAVSDALDLLRAPGAVTGLGALWPVPEPVIGRVRTVQAAPRSPDSPGTHIATPLVAVAKPGDVVVIANAGRVDVSCWGGLLSVAARVRGVSGVIIDGACRDIAESQAEELAIFGRAVVPVSARGRIVQASMDEPIQVGEVTVHSGDYVIADRSGVVFVSADQASQVIDLAGRIVQREQAMEAAARGGRPIDAVMHDSQFPAVTADA